MKKQKNTETFTRQSGYLPSAPRRRSPLKFCMLCGVREVVIYFKFQGSRDCRWSKIALSHSLGPLLIEQLVQPYKPCMHNVQHRLSKISR